jgi:hypothetical protein
MSALDDLAIYVFVRQDLTEQDQRIQTIPAGSSTINCS